MSNMGRTTVKPCRSIKVTCHELTIAELRGVLARKVTSDLITEALFSDISLDDLQVFTSLSGDEIEASRPSDLDEVRAGCREANPDFFELMGRLDRARESS